MKKREKPVESCGWLEGKTSTYISDSFLTSKETKKEEERKPAILRHSSIIHNKSIFPFHRDRIMFNKENCFFFFLLSFGLFSFPSFHLREKES